MARFNKIYLGPVTAALHQVVELPAAAAILPGSLVVATAGTFALAGATTVGKTYLAQDNYLVQEGTDTAIAIGDVLIGMELLPDRIYAARVADAQNLALGDALTPGAAGVLVKASTTDFVVATADETYNNNTGSVQLVRVRPATGYLTAA